MSKESTKEIHQCFILTHSPIHVGCDEVYEPTGFTLDEAGCQLIVFDPFTFIAEMEDADRVTFSKICSRGTVASILEIYKFLQPRKADGRRVDVCKEFLEHHRQTLSIPLRDERRIQQELNSFTISRTAYLAGDHRPYIPGSSVKGALRTAYLNQLEKQMNLSRTNTAFRKGEELEKALMDYDAIHSDPFRMVKISDFHPVGDVRPKVIYAVNRRKKGASPSGRGPAQLLEVIAPGAAFLGTITVDRSESAWGMPKAIELKGLLAAMEAFYWQEKERENRELRAIGGRPDASGIPLRGMQDGQVLIRLGRHSGAECMTVEGHRKILIRQAGGGFPKGKAATTLWLASQTRKPRNAALLLPFGWASIHALSHEKAEEFDDLEREWAARSRQERIARQDRIATALAEKARLEEDEARRLAEEKKARLEDEKRLALLAAMSPEERDITKVEAGEADENEVVKIYQRIESYPDEYRIRLAIALKEYWKTENKWAKRNCSKKQWAKVQKVKSILGEN